MKIQRDRDAQLAAAAQSKEMIKEHEKHVHAASHKHRVTRLADCSALSQDLVCSDAEDRVLP